MLAATADRRRCSGAISLESLSGTLQSQESIETENILGCVNLESTVGRFSVPKGWGQISDPEVSLGGMRFAFHD